MLAVVTEAGIGIVSQYSIPVEVVVLVQKSAWGKHYFLERRFPRLAIGLHWAFHRELFRGDLG